MLFWEYYKSKCEFKAQVPANIGIPKNVDKLIVDLEIVQGASLYGYKEDLEQKFLKIYIRSPKLLNLCKCDYSFILMSDKH